QSSKNAYAMMGFNLENIQIAYSYRINTGLYKTIAAGTHELTLAVKIGKRKEGVIYNPTLVEIDHRASKLLNKRVTPENKSEVMEELNELKQLIKNTKINESTPEAAEEATRYLNSIEQKIIALQEKLK